MKIGTKKRPHSRSHHHITKSINPAIKQPHSRKQSPSRPFYPHLQAQCKAIAQRSEEKPLKRKADVSPCKEKNRFEIFSPFSRLCLNPLVLKAFRPFSPIIEKTASFYAPYLPIGVESLLFVFLSGKINNRRLTGLYSAECAETAVNRKQCTCNEASGIAAQELYGSVQFVDVAEAFHRGFGQYFLAAVGQ